MILSRLLLSAALLLLPFALSAQDCVAALEQASSNYKSGKIYQVVPLIAPYLDTDCLERKQKVAACRIIAQVYAELNQPDSADYMVRKLLKMDHFYQPQPSIDTQEFIDLVSSYHVYPRVATSLFGGINSTSVWVTKHRAVFENEKFSEKYTPRASLVVGINLSFFISPRFSLTTGLTTSYNRYDYSFSDSIAAFDAGKPLMYWNYKYRQVLNYMEFPCYLTCYAGRSNLKIRPFFNIGGYAGKLFSSTRNISWQTDGGNTITDNFNPTISMHRRWTRGILLGGGITWQQQSGALTVDLSYQQSTVNLANNKRYADNTDWMMYTYYDVQDDLVLSHVRARVSFTYYWNYRVHKIRQKQKQQMPD